MTNNIPLSATFDNSAAKKAADDLAGSLRGVGDAAAVVGEAIEKVTNRAAATSRGMAAFERSVAGSARNLEKLAQIEAAAQRMLEKEPQNREAIIAALEKQRQKLAGVAAATEGASSASRQWVTDTGAVVASLGHVEAGARQMQAAIAAATATGKAGFGDLVQAAQTLGRAQADLAAMTGTQATINRMTGVSGNLALAIDPDVRRDYEALWQGLADVAQRKAVELSAHAQRAVNEATGVRYWGEASAEARAEYEAFWQAIEQEQVTRATRLAGRAQTIVNEAAGVRYWGPLTQEVVSDYEGMWSRLLAEQDAGAARLAQQVANDNERLAASYRAVMAGIDPAIAAQQRFDKALADLRAGAAAAGRSAEDLAADEAKLTAALSPAAVAAKKQADELENLRRTVDRNGYALKELDEQQRKLNAAYASGELTMSAAEHQALNAAIEQHRRGIVASTASYKEMRNAVGLTNYQMMALAPQINDVVSGIAMGQTPMMIFTQQSGQIVQVLQSQGVAFSAVKLGAVAFYGAIAAVAVAVVAGVAALESYRASVREVELATTLAGTTFGMTKDAMLDFAASSADAGGISVKAARSLVAEYTRLGKIAPEVMGEMIALSRDYAAVTGQDASEAASELGKKLRDPARAAEELADAYGLLSDAQVRQIRFLAESGDRTEAQIRVLDALKTRIGDAAQLTSGWTRFWQTFGTALSDAFDAFGAAMERGIDGPRGLEALEAAQQRVSEIRASIAADMERIRQETGGAVGADAVPLDPRFAARGTGAQGARDLFSAQDAENAAAYAVAVESAEAAIAAIAAEARRDRAFGELSRQILPAVEQTEKLTAAQALLTKAVASGVGDTNLYARALREVDAQLKRVKAQEEDLTAVRASGLDLETIKLQERLKIEQSFTGRFGADAEQQKAGQLALADAFGTATSEMERAARASASVTQVIVNQAKALVDAVKGLRDEISLLKVPAGLERDIARLQQQMQGNLPTAPRNLMDAIGQAGNRYGVDPALLAALASKESSFNPNAINMKSGAGGLFQFMPATAQQYGIGDRFMDPMSQIDAAARYVSDLLKKYGGNVELALKEYGGFVKKDPTAYTTDVLARRDAYAAGQQIAGTVRERNAAVIADESRQIDLQNRLLAIQTQASASLTDQQARLAAATRAGGVAQKLLSTEGAAVTDAFLRQVEGGKTATEALDALAAQGIVVADAVRQYDTAMASSGVAEHKKAVTELTRGLTLGEQAQRRLAEAAGLGEAAQRYAEYANSVDAARATLGEAGAAAQDAANKIAEQTKVTAIRNEFTRGINEEVKANERLIAAYGQGSVAVKDAERYAAAYAQTLRVVKKDEAGWTDELNKNIAKLKERDLSNLRRDIAAYSETLRRAQDDLNIEATAATLGESAASELRARHEALKALNLTIERYGALDTATRRQVDTQLDAAAALDRQQQGVERYKQAWETVTGSLENAFDRLGDALVDAVVSGKDATLDWGKLATSVIASIASDLAKLAIANPLKNLLFGGNAPTIMDLFGGTATTAVSSVAGKPVTIGGQTYVPAGQGGVGTGGLSIGSLSRLTDPSALPSWWNRSVFGPSGSTANSVGVINDGTAGFDTTGAFDVAGNPIGGSVGPTWGQVATGAGAALSAFNAFTAFSRGQIGSGIGNTVSAGLGVASLAGVSLGALGPIGMIAAPILGGLLDGLFAKKPSTKEGGSTINLATGAETIGGQTGKKFSQENRDAASDLSNAVYDMYEGLSDLAGGMKLTNDFFVGVGDRDGIRAQYNGPSNEKFFTRDDQGVKDMTAWFAGVFTRELKSGFEEPVQRAIDNIQWDTLEDGLEQLQFALDFGVTMDNLAGNFSLENAARTQAKDAVKQTTKAFEELLDTTAQLWPSIQQGGQTVTTTTRELTSMSAAEAISKGLIRQVETYVGEGMNETVWQDLAGNIVTVASDLSGAVSVWQEVTKTVTEGGQAVKSAELARAEAAVRDRVNLLIAGVPEQTFTAMESSVAAAKASWDQATVKPLLEMAGYLASEVPAKAAEGLANAMARLRASNDQGQISRELALGGVDMSTGATAAAQYATAIRDVTALYEAGATRTAELAQEQRLLNDTLLASVGLGRPVSAMSVPVRDFTAALGLSAAAVAPVTAALDSMQAAALNGTANSQTLTDTVNHLSNLLSATTLDADDFAAAVGRVTSQMREAVAVTAAIRQGSDSVMATINPAYRTGVADVMAQAGIASSVSGVADYLGALRTQAIQGAASVETMGNALAHFGNLLRAGAITADQYGTLISYINTQFASATATEDARRAGMVSIAQTVDPSYRPSADVALSGLQLSSQAIVALRGSIDGLYTSARAGTLAASDLYAAETLVRQQMTTGTITAEQYTSIIGLITQAWQDSGAAAQAASDRARALRDSNADLLGRRQTLMGDTAGAALTSFDLRAAQQIESAAAAGQDTAALRVTLAAERAQQVFDLARADYIERIDREIRAREESTESLREHALRVSEIAKSFRDAAASLRLSEDGDKSPKERLDEIRKQFEDAVTGYRAAGDDLAKREEWAQKLQSLGQQRVDIASGFFQTTDYSDYRRVLAVFDEFGVATDAATSSAEETIRQNDLMIAALQDQRQAAERLGERQLGSLDGLRGAMEGAKATLDAQLAQLRATPAPQVNVTVNGTSVTTGTGDVSTILTPEQRYLAANPDVAANDYYRTHVAEHYALAGAAEGRDRQGLVLTRDQEYLARYPDVAAAVRRGEYTDGRDHYDRFGRSEGRQYAAGGLVTGGPPGTDTVRAWLTNGERVLSVPHARMLETIYGMAAAGRGPDRIAIVAPPANDRVPANVADLRPPARPERADVAERREMVDLLLRILDEMKRARSDQRDQIDAVAAMLEAKLEELAQLQDDARYEFSKRRTAG